MQSTVQDDEKMVEEKMESTSAAPVQSVSVADRRMYNDNRLANNAKPDSRSVPDKHTNIIVSPPVRGMEFFYILQNTRDNCHFIIYDSSK